MAYIPRLPKCAFNLKKKIISHLNEKSASIYFGRLEDNGAEGKVLTLALQCLGANHSFFTKHTHVAAKHP